MSSPNLKQCVTRIQRRFGKNLPAVALVLGSGFEAIAQALENVSSVNYSELPGFPVPTVAGHAGALVCAELNGLPILVCCGRAHYYEGASMEQVTYPTRVLGELGVSMLLLTNAAGGINPKFRPGDFMLFSDHINLSGVNPLRGLPAEDGRCFVELGEAYSPRLRHILKTAARQAKTSLHEGVYLCVSGPSYETPAEIRAFRRLGADAVGMSTVPEVLMARYSGIEVAALSCITNLAAGLTAGRLSHEEVLAVGQENARKAANLLTLAAPNLLERGRKTKKV